MSSESKHPAKRQKGKKPSGQDQIFYEKALQLANTANRALEEANQYVEGIQHKELQAQARSEIESLC